MITVVHNYNCWSCIIQINMLHVNSSILEWKKITVIMRSSGFLIRINLSFDGWKKTLKENVRTFENCRCSWNNVVNSDIMMLTICDGWNSLRKSNFSGTCTFENGQCGWNDVSSGRYNFHIFQGQSPGQSGPQTDHTIKTAAGKLDCPLHSLYNISSVWLHVSIKCYQQQSGLWNRIDAVVRLL